MVNASLALMLCAICLIESNWPQNNLKYMGENLYGLFKTAANMDERFLERTYNA